MKRYLLIQKAWLNCVLVPAGETITVDDDFLPNPFMILQDIPVPVVEEVVAPAPVEPPAEDAPPVDPPSEVPEAPAP